MDEGLENNNNNDSQSNNIPASESLNDNFGFQNRIDIDSVSNSIDRARAEIQKVIIGQREMIDLLLVCLLADGHALVEGVPGIAKTLATKLMAKTIDTNFSRIQFTPDLMPSDVIGTSVFNFKTSDFDFKKGPIFSNIVLIDEINRAPAKTQAALFEVMEERQITADGNFFKMEPPFMVLATQNPIEQEGTYRLPEAQLDRFLMKIQVNYPTELEEVEIIKSFHENRNLHNLEDTQAVVNPADLIACKAVVQQIRVEEKLMQYIAQIVTSSRNNKDLYLGASPRASLAILQTAKAYALMQGRDFVTPEDIQFVAKPVMRHRIILSPEREMEGITADKAIERIVEQVEVPR